MSRLKKQKRGKEQTSIGIVASLDGSSENGLRIVMLRTDGCTGTVTTLVNITKDGMKYIRSHGLSKMFEISGAKEIVGSLENGND